MGLGISPASRGHAREHGVERVGRREVPVHHGECLAIVTTHPDLETSALGRLHHSRDLEAAEFTPDLTMLDRHISASGDEHPDQRTRLGGGFRGDRCRRRFCFDERSPVDAPDPRAVTELRGPTGEDAGGLG